ncbi:iron chaperone [Bifidobacterium thermophilum]|uniref:iron chaperone n=1 Tax=Bifidobacterium thermophilum TaxID=33905 RepID=UPI003995FE10
MAKYANVEEYLGSIADERHRAKFRELLDWVQATWPQLVCEVKWNQPMFMDHGTFIIGFTALTNHVTVGSEQRAFEHAMPLIEQQHLKRGKKTFQIPYKRSDAWEVLEQIIEFTIADKRDVQTFWDQRRPGY